MSRDKGCRGERELANKFKDLGWGCHRGRQYKGTSDSPDVAGLEGIYIESKRVESPNWTDNWLVKARSEASETDLPIFCHRRNNEPWKVTMHIEDWEKMYRAYYEMRIYNEPIPFEVVEGEEE